MTRIRSLSACIFLLLTLYVGAHWETHDHLPQYARRGVLRACVAPFGGAQLAEWLDADPLACHYNLIFTAQPAWENPLIHTADVVSRYLQPRNGNLFFYTCPNSIYYDAEFERVDFREDVRFERYRWDTFARFPYAKDQIVIGRDEKPLLAYVWPSTRHRTSYFSTLWLEHHAQVMAYHILGKDAVTNPHLKPWLTDLKYPGINGGFYYDNSGLRQDWGPLAMAKWAALSQKEFGWVVDPKTATDLRVRMLWEDMQYRAFLEYHDHLRQVAWSFDTPRLSMQPSKGVPGYYAAELDYPDIEFYENSGKMLPQSDNIWDLKCGLARTHGKAQALLTHDHFPRPRLDREGNFVVLNWKLNEAFTRLMLAESLAMNAAHMVQIGPMIYDTMRVGATVNLFHTFNKELEEEVYREALPASRLLVMNPITSEAHGSAENDPLGERLWRQGWAYEVIIEHDLSEAYWKQMEAEVLVLPDVRCLNEDRLAVLLDWVKQGGRVLVTQQLATRDELGVPRVSVLAPQLLGNVPTRLSFNAAYDCHLEGFVPEKDGRVWLPTNFHTNEKTAEGTITLTFNGASGQYDIRVVYIDESDGNSQLALHRNGVVLDEIPLAENDDARKVRTLSNLAVANGDTFQIHGKMDLTGDEFVRVLDIEFVPVGADLHTVSYRELGKGLVAYAPQSLMAYDDAEFQVIMARMTDGRGSRVDYTPGETDLGSIFMNLMRDHGRRGLQAHLVNATYTTPERYATITSTDQVLRAEITLDAVPEKPVLRALVFGIGEGWQFVANVNGQDLAPIDAAAIRDTCYIDFPIDPALLRSDAANVVTLRGTGAVGAFGSHVAVYLDTEQSAPASAYSTDAGATFGSTDLSALNGVQTGAYMLQILADPGRTPAPEMRARLVQQRKVQVQLNPADVPNDAQALLISPESAPRRLRVEHQAHRVLVTVPELAVYSVLIVSADAAYLDATEAKARGIRFDPLPPRTPEFRELLAMGAVGERLSQGDLEGDFRLRGVEQIDPATVNVRDSDRYFGKDLTAGKDYVVHPDGRLEAMPGLRAAGGTVFLSLTDIPGDHYREPYTPYTRVSDSILLPPGWSLSGPADATRIERTSAPADYRDGEAAVRVTGQVRSGLGCGTGWLDIGRPYGMTVWLRVDAGQARVTLVNGAEQTLTQTVNPGEWQRVDLRFVAQDHHAVLRVAAELPDSSFVMDAASIRELPE